MNQTLEKWLTIAALTGWIASIASLVGLAVRATAPAVASRPAQSSAQPFGISAQDVQAQRLAGKVSPGKSLAATIPLDTAKGYWVRSLKDQSYSSK